MLGSSASSEQNWRTKPAAQSAQACAGADIRHLGVWTVTVRLKEREVSALLLRCTHPSQPPILFAGIESDGPQTAHRRAASH